MLRKLAIVAILASAMLLANSLTGQAEGGQLALAMASLGFIVLAAFTLGELGERIHLPHITGYLAAGVVFGEDFAEMVNAALGTGMVPLLSKAVVRELKIFDILAIALIAMEAGSALDLGSLRKGWRGVAVLSLAIIAVSMASGVAFTATTSGVVPFFSLPFLEGADGRLLLAVGLLLGVLVMATSPPVTLAVISETRARGPFSSALLSTVILNNVLVVVLLALAVTVARSLLGMGGGEGAGRVMVQLAVSLALGVGLGSVAGAVMRYLKREALPALVGLCFVGTFLSTRTDEIAWIGVEASPLLTFLTAGALLNNATSQGPAFKTVASRLSGPVYVLFFTLVGANLHLHEVKIMFPFAVTLVALRLGGYATAINLANRVAPLPDTLTRYGFLGLAPQAGIALAVADSVEAKFAGWGAAFKTLALAAIACNEATGPVLLKWSLGLAQETGRGETDAEAEAAPSAPAASPLSAEHAAADEEQSFGRPGLAEWLPEPGRPSFDAWSGPPQTGTARLDELCRALAADLQGMVRDLRTGVVARRRDEAQAFIHQLRREFLRTHRRAIQRASDEGVSAAGLTIFLRQQRAELATRWKALLLDRAAVVDFRREQEVVDAIVRGVERLVEALPSASAAPLEPSHLASAPGDSWLASAGKLWRRTLRRLPGSGGETRTVEVRALGRYHLSGHVPLYLQDEVGLLTLAEVHLLNRARNLFEVYDRTLDTLIGALEASGGEGVVARAAAVSAFRDEIEEELSLASREVDRLSDETVRVAEGSLGRAWRALVEAMRRAGTPALPSRAYRYSRVYEARQRAVARLGEALDSARDRVKGLAGALAMELELVRLRNLLHESVSSAASEVGRDVRGRIAVQLHRVGDALRDTLSALRRVLASPPREPRELQVRLEAATAPLGRVVADAVGIAEQLRTALRAQSPFETLLGAVARELDHLTDHFEVLFEARVRAGRGLPPKPQLVTVPFRDLVRSFMELEVGRDLAQLAESLETQVDEAYNGIGEVDRVLSFNVELTRAELEVLPEGAMPSLTLEVLEDSLIGTLQRVAHRVAELHNASVALAERTEKGVQDAVLGSLDRLHGKLVAGRLSELRARQAQQSLAESRRELRGAASRVGRVMGQLVGLARSTVGEEALVEARRVVGLPTDGSEPGTTAFRIPPERIEIPLAYRRLFSDQALEAGDLLTGREAEVARVRRLLLGESPGVSRAVAVIAVGGMGKGAVVTALTRGLGERAKLIRFELSGPLEDADAVADLVEAARRARDSNPPSIVVVEGFQWLFSIRPGGFDLMRRFVDGVVETADQVGWLVSADRPVWAYVNRVVPLHDAFPERVHLDTLDVGELQRAVLARHALSGYDLRFRQPDRNLRWWVLQRLNPPGRLRPLYEASYFKALHRDSGGVLSDALRLWLSSITSLDGERDVITVGPVPHPPIRAIRQLPDDVIITLRQVARQGRLTPENHARQFRVEPEVSRAFLARLSHWGLLYRDEEGGYRFQPDLAGPLYRVLHERKIVG